MSERMGISLGQTPNSEQRLKPYLSFGFVEFKVNKEVIEVKAVCNDFTESTDASKKKDLSDFVATFARQMAQILTNVCEIMPRSWANLWKCFIC